MTRINTDDKTETNDCLCIPVGNYNEHNWATQCGNMFTLNDGTPTDNGFYFCPYCGKVLRQEQQ